MTEQITIRNTTLHRLEFYTAYYGEDLQNIFDAPDSYLHPDRGIVLQNNFKSTIGILSTAIGKIVIKRHNFKSRWQQFKRLFRKTKSRNSWNYSIILKENGIYVPSPIACLEKCYGPFKGMSYFLYEYVEGIQGEEYFRQIAASPVQIRSAMTEILDIIDRITNLRLIHGDIRLANFLFSDGKIYLIDFDDMRPRRWYHTGSARDRDIRGFRKDLCYNTEGSVRDQLLEQLETYCKQNKITISGPDYRKLIE